MTTMFVRHQVSDYKKWRQTYDEFNPTRKSMGVTDASVFRAPDNPNDVTVLHSFSTAAKAHEFADSPALKDAMKKAGVGTPTIWFADKA